MSAGHVGDESMEFMEGRHSPQFIEQPEGRKRPVSTLNRETEALGDEMSSDSAEFDMRKRRRVTNTSSELKTQAGMFHRSHYNGFFLCM